jgi:hypothetical protein
MKLITQHEIVALAAIGLSLPLLSSASNLDFIVDFGTVYPSSSNTVNDVTTYNASTSITKDTNGNTLSGISLTSTGAISIGASSTSAWGSSTIDWVTPTMGTDFMNLGNGSTDGTTGTITITGLSAGSYKIQLVSAQNNATSLADIKVAGSDSVYAFADSDYNNSGATGDNWQALSNGKNNILIWDAIYISTGGTITITFTDVSSSSNIMFLNALRVTAVPEPAQVASVFGGLALLGAWFARKKRRS